MRIAASIEYAGQNFSGWQKQPRVKTIQGELEKAIFSITKQNIGTTAAGRTDSGVHALGQVIHFDTKLKRSMHSWVKGINAFLLLLNLTPTNQLLNIFNIIPSLPGCSL